MLSDAEIERWSRQILVPEVGGRGQTRLCDAGVEIVGADGPAALTAELVERAGPRVTVMDTPSGHADVVIAWGTAPDASAAARGVLGVVHGARAVVAGVAAAPCAACVALPALGGDVPAEVPLARLTSRIAATLAAAEVVRLLLVPAAGGRVHRVDLAAGSFTAEDARAAGECAVCGVPA
jgi:hypothetical protein